MTLLEYFDAKKLLDKHKVNSIESKYVSSASEAARFAKNSPIALKLISGKALHKSKSGLVKLNLRGDKEIKSAFEELARKGKQLTPYKIIAQKMASKGIEIIIGGNTDPQFGKLILIGLGGIYVEVFKDTALRTCPISRADAQDMIEQLKSKDVITYNGKNKKMLIDLLINVSNMLTENKEILELDLNPVVLREESYDVVDIRILK